MDRNDFVFDDMWVNDDLGTITFYYSTSLETLKSLTDAHDTELLYGADSATLSIECPNPCKQPVVEYASVMISPCVKGSDVDWADVDFPDSDLLEQLIVVGFNVKGYDEWDKDYQQFILEKFFGECVRYWERTLKTDADLDVMPFLKAMKEIPLKYPYAPDGKDFDPDIRQTFVKCRYMDCYGRDWEDKYNHDFPGENSRSIN